MVRKLLGARLGNKDNLANSLGTESCNTDSLCSISHLITHLSAEPIAQHDTAACPAPSARSAYRRHDRDFDRKTQ